MNLRHSTKLLVTSLAVLALAAMLATAASATAPAKGYEAFAGCPSPEENPAVTICQRGVIDGGHFQMGSKDVPITNPITLSGGLPQKASWLPTKTAG